LPRAIELMRQREEELLRVLSYLSERTSSFSDPRLILIGGYALRAFISFARFTRDCDFAIKKQKEEWIIDKLLGFLPEEFSVERLEKLDSYGFMRCVKFVKHNRAGVKVSLDFMEGEIRGRGQKDVILIDDAMIKGVKTTISVAGEKITVIVPSYVDYFIMKVISARPSDVRDIASLVIEQGIPQGLSTRIRQILPYPEVFRSKFEEIIIPAMKRKSFIDSWRGIFGTTKYTEEDKRKVISSLEKLLKELQESLQ